MKLCTMIDSSRGWALVARRLRLGPVVLVAVVLLASCGVARGPAASPAPAGSTVIPWIAVPGTPLPPTLPPPAHIACTAATLALDGLYAGAYQGNAAENLHLTNSGPAACFFPGVPQLEITLASGTREAVSPGAFATQHVDLQPHQLVEIGFGSPGWCPTFNPGTPLPAKSLQVTFATGGSLTVTGLTLDVQCGPPKVLLFEAVALSTTVSSSPLSALQAARIAPSQASRGSTLTYTVTLTNPTAMALVLSPCPSYTEGISNDAGAQDQETWLLNCQVAQQIPAGSSLTFAMQYAVPSRFPVGAAKLFWILQVPGGPAAGSEIMVS